MPVFNVTGSVDVKKVIKVQKIKLFVIHETKFYFTEEAIYLHADCNTYVLADIKCICIQFMQKIKCRCIQFMQKIAVSFGSRV